MYDEAQGVPTGDLPAPRPPATPPPARTTKRVLIGIGAAVGLAALVVIVVALESAGPKPKGTQVTATTQAAGVGTSPTPVPSTVPPTPEAALIARVPSSYRGTCRTLADQDKRTDFRNVPAITCDPTSALSVFLYQLPDPTLMNEEYISVVEANSLGSATCDPKSNAGFRAASTYSTGSSVRGKALCYVGADNAVRMEWTDDALNVYGSIAADDSAANRQLVYQFWVANGALLR